MSNVRRVNDRRRRVLYSAHQAEQHPSTAASRNEMRRLREARRPQEAYGSRVQRRLQGRWFSLVPVRHRSMMAITSILVGLACLLCFAHYVAVAWPSIAYRPEIARPLRLDRPDSFGHCLMVTFLTASAGVSLLIYQLRRYRNDDFKGHYRLWRIVMIVMMLASVNAMVGVIGWSGAILDSMFGKRVALTGDDWVRLVVSFGSAVLALRLLADIRRCRSALALMAAACLLLAVPEAAKWNVLSVDSLGRWLTVTSAPLLACTALFLSLGSYLRMLYREVRQIEDSEPISVRLRQLRDKWLSRSSEEDDSEEEEFEASPRWWQRKASSKESKPSVPKPKVRQRQEEDEEPEEPDVQRPKSTSASPRRTASRSQPTEDVVGSVAEEESKAASKDAKPKRRWFGLRAAKSPKPEKQVKKSEAATTKKTETSQPEKKKRGRFSLRLKPVAAASKEPSSEPANDETKQDKSTQARESNGTEKSKPKSSRGLGWFRRKKSEASEQEKASKPGSAPHSPASSSAPASDDQDQIDTDDIDWDSLSKAERRRLRKQLKRQNRAA